MRAMQVRALGAPLELHDVAMPEPGAGEVRLRVLACGLNFADTLVQVGKYQEKFDLPVTPGMELCGVVDALGDGVDSLRVGQRVAANPGHGGLADYAVTPASACVPISDTMSDADAAAFLVAYASSHMALDHRAHLRPGERLLVLGASGGVGLTAVELGKLMGAEVIACARGADKLEIARNAGADHLIDSDTDDLREVVLGLGGADVVYDPIGGDLFTAAMRACNPEARILPIGFASGTVPQIPANILLVKNLTVIGFYVGGYKRFAPDVLTRSFAQLIAWYDAGQLRPHVSNILTLDQANAGLDLLRTRQATGKVVIEISAA
ncbi:NADPH:quinone oxidoreductase family protein [Sulfitobacter pseudonitzschiae]|uniref:NADPH:quinone oxidoreductase family protein n=1 Tax=Pseudosulfitobacter pseudonitzschiae TaxID=1402135 RepID=A0A9Q2NN57_9RHOB|nr:NADPH:quinone oxidoreductase family protein [Pseudosulfitobacter pseudonitzschiae]MBM2291849.1 NADPH:quinone oxidoreductase family protein [Pseudosulfitobacter pseudonitzschiae]MBM2296767.1 NADPH:quinone oxidoreductase family protein [Pseudosulfitobacter pseudonitzschiae]MBM2301680.1 NADPH:quinone oxidoreductase family protein [Pseudosulfitobacter pseudonitzschiae]MBM2311463.1 NADPH:quinone oxidoreductase family protein [Pseudosulfitobacter pseudonitzschiae]MBM2316377.1 NADPH:quinone oxidor